MDHTNRVAARDRAVFGRWRRGEETPRTDGIGRRLDIRPVEDTTGSPYGRGRKGSVLVSQGAMRQRPEDRLSSFVASSNSAEGEGFEPPVGCPTMVFKTIALVRSAIPPWEF